mmetsp:Transcript_42745/g.89299  ORF Transcript_42745/g.89299 Transcript_42745/m.89299 type:complete len:307 (-) Transcript_42745:306-1226(-)
MRCRRKLVDGGHLRRRRHRRRHVDAVLDGRQHFRLELFLQLLHLLHPLLERAARPEMVEVDSGVRRADAPHAFECLPLQRRAPLGVEQQHDVGGLQVETHTTGACRCEEQRRQLGGGEGAHDVHALFLAHLAVDPPVAAHAAHAVRAKRRTEFELRRIERRVVRGEDDDLVDAPPIPDAAPRGLECHAVFFLRSKAARSNDSIEITPLCPGKYSCSGLCCLLQLESRKRRCCTWSGRVRLFISLCSRRLRGLNDCLRGLANTDARLMNARRPAICKSDCDLFFGCAHNNPVIIFVGSFRHSHVVTY